MDDKAKLINEVYNQFQISSNQYFVALQKIYNMIAKFYWGDAIQQFEDDWGHIKEYSALNELFDSVQLSNMNWRAFRGLWKHANKIKHSNEVLEFSPDYARLCAETYNSIVDEVLPDEAMTFKLEIANFISKEDTNDYSETVADAFKHALKRAEEHSMQQVIVLREEERRRKKLKLCPECNAPLELRTRRVDGAKFWGCSNWKPDRTGCNFTMNYIPEKEPDNNLTKNDEVSDSINAELKVNFKFENIPVKYKNETHWFIARERKKGCKVQFIQSLGITAPALKEINGSEETKNNYKRCSHWRFDYDFATPRNISEELKLVSGLAYKLLTRGKLTLLSHKVEEYITSSFEMQLDMPDALLNYQTMHRKPNYYLDGNGTENYFYTDILPRILGRGFEHYVIPQVALASIVSTKEDIGQQRVDFAINDGRNKLVIELDDPAHIEHQSYDKVRDTLLNDSGYRVYRIPNSEVNPDSNHIKQLASEFVRVDVNSEQLYSMKGLISGKIIHQLETVVVFGLMHGIYDIDQSIAVDLDTDIFSAAEAESILAIASADLNELLSRIAKLYSIELIFNLRFSQKSITTEIQKEITYNTDNSASENRTVITDFAYASDFMNNMPIYGNIGQYSGDEETVLYFLNYLFRKDNFREGQFEAISNTLKKRDSVVLLPTGHGKSIAFQLASMLTNGSTFVVSPLVALMLDQVDNLNQYGIDRAKALTGGLSNEEKEEMSELIISGDSIITYISPERLQIEDFRKTLEDTLREIPIPLFVIDEAHCLSEWGHDFRTSYLNLGRIIRTHCKYNGLPPTIIALTGTASDNVLTDIRNQLGIWDDGSLITPNKFDRKELHYRVLTCKSSEKQQKLLEVLDYIPSYFGLEKGEFFELNDDNTYCGLVFCPWINGDFGIYEISKLLANNGHSCEMYGGKMPKNWSGNLSWEQQKSKATQDFKNNKCNLLVATKAYGMGIDKSNIRYIIHYNIAQSIESYYQETGRAGRDHQDAVCILLASLDNNNDDYKRIVYFHNRAYRGQSVELDHISEIVDFIFSEPKDRNFSTAGKSEENQISYEKAIYRLLLIGVIDDYTKIRRDEYSLTINDISRQKIRASYLKCISKYHEGRVNSEAEKIDALHTDNIKDFVKAVSSLLIDFLYDNIVASRQAAMDSMRDLAQAAANADDQDQFIHTEIENYLSNGNQDAIGIITKGDRAGLKESADFYINGDYQSLNAIRGQITRQIESHPDHPGLLLARAYIDSIHEDYSNEKDILNDIGKSIHFAQTRYSATKEDLKTYFGWMVTEIAKSNETFALKICAHLRDVYSSTELFEIVEKIADKESELVPFAYSYFADMSSNVLEIIGGRKDE
ncbi:RecQ family ATP-dependent DNA helicase [Hornefia butyriciproducens]|uniref:RecQ family ATP-dependent DNA helicase n=1 Tax=Hornefia butyriciproducens TaxID=2652293 RepID=UPI003F8AAB86